MQRLHQVFLGFRVEGGCGFVEDQDARIAHESPGDGDALLLADGELAHACAELGVVAFGQGRDEVVGAGNSRHAFDLLNAGIRFTEADVVSNGVRE